MDERVTIATLEKVLRENDVDQVRELWHTAKGRGFSRRRFLQMLSLGGATAVLAACQQRDEEATPVGEADEEASWAKDTGPFNELGTNLETQWWRLDGWITPTQLFFVRNNAPASPRLSAEDWRLRIQGDAVENPIEINYEQLRNMPSRTVLSYLECAGNFRSLFERVMGQPAEGGQWTLGAVGMASWTGVPLSHVLEMAGVSSNAVDVVPQGLDTEAPEGGFQKPMAIDKAMDPDTLLVHTMNGEDLPVDHGYPVRVLVPGWVGSNSIKWVGSIDVASEQQFTRNNTTSYVLIGPQWPSEQYGPSEGQPVYENNIKSFLALPWEARLGAGTHRLHGYAYSPVAPIQRVEWSDDGGQTWQEARITSPQLDTPYAWSRFEFIWEAQPGNQGLMTRATDTAGNTQPSEIPFNEKGYIFNMTFQHPVEVTG